jgi:hypothetical protein
MCRSIPRNRVVLFDSFATSFVGSFVRCRLFGNGNFLATSSAFNLFAGESGSSVSPAKGRMAVNPGSVRLLRRAGSFFSFALIVTSLTPTASAAVPEVKGAQKTDCARFLPYAPQRDHLWNRIHHKLFDRITGDGKILGCDETDPLLWNATTRVLAEPAFSETVTLLDSFLAGHGERLVRDALRRAIFQHDLWAFFDWLVDPSVGQPHQGFPPYQEQRQQLARRIARMIRSVALTQAEIERLPNNFQQLQSSRAKGLLPELPDVSQGWVMLGRDDNTIPAPMHSKIVSPRSVFLVFLKLPGDGTTGPYVEQLRSYSRTRKPEEDCSKKPCRPPQFPPGTQVALVRRALLIDVAGKAVMSPLTEMVQLRRYLSVPDMRNGFRQTHRPLPAISPQQFAEFRFRRELLLSGQSSLHELSEMEPAFVTGPLIEDVDFIDKYGDTRGSPLHFCLGCHQGPGVVSVMTYSQMFEEKKFLMPRSAAVSEEAVAIRYLESLGSWRSLNRMMSDERNAGPAH